jgi:protein-glutamine gamma-glutamyltransferase
MNLVRVFPKVVFAMAMLGLVAFCVAHRSIELMVVSGAAAAMSWYVTEGPRGRTLPRWVSNVLLVVVVLSLLVDLSQNHQPEQVMGVVGRFAVWLVLIKLYERKRARDYAQVMALSVVLVLAGCLETAELIFALVLLVYVLVGMHALVLFQLYAGYESAKQRRRAEAPPAARLVPPVQPSHGGGISSHFRRLVGAMAVVAIAVSVGVFVLFPRGIWMDPSLGSRFGPRSTGFAPEVNLMDGGSIAESRREVFTVRLLDQNGAPFKYKSPLLLRGSVLDQYMPESGRWKVGSASSGARDHALLSDAWKPLHTEPIDDRTPVFTLEFTMRSMAAEPIFSMYAPLAIASESPREVRVDRSTLVLHDRTRDRRAKLSGYRVRVCPFPTDAVIKALGAPAHETLKNDEAARAKKEISPAVRAEAERILQAAGLHEPSANDAAATWEYHRAAAQAIVNSLHSLKYRYTTDLSEFTRLRHEDPIEAFLRQRFGHCEFFASAMAAMCRAVNVPARLVTGYMAYEYDDSSEHYVVRESNAHAWVEVQTQEYVWTPFDPTPPQELEAFIAAQRSWTDHIRWLYDSFEFQWNSRFVSFDSSTQATFVNQLNSGWGRWMREAYESFRGWAASINRRFEFGPAGYIWIGMLGLIVVLAVVAAVKIIRRVRAIMHIAHLERLRGCDFRRLLRDAAFYLDLLLILDRGGAPKPPWMPPHQFALELQALAAPEAADVHAVVQRYYDVRYGGRRLSSEEAADVHRRLDRLARGFGLRGRRSVGL